MKAYLQEQLMSVYQSISDNYLESLLLIGIALLPFLAFFVYGLAKSLNIGKWAVFYISITAVLALLVVTPLAYLLYSRTTFDDALSVFCESKNETKLNIEKNINNQWNAKPIFFSKNKKAFIDFCKQ